MDDNSENQGKSTRPRFLTMTIAGLVVLVITRYVVFSSVQINKNWAGKKEKNRILKIDNNKKGAAEKEVTKER